MTINPILSVYFQFSIGQMYTLLSTVTMKEKYMKQTPENAIILQCAWESSKMCKSKVHFVCTETQVEYHNREDFQTKIECI